jgi:TonB family protein
MAWVWRCCEKRGAPRFTFATKPRASPEFTNCCLRPLFRGPRKKTVIPKRPPQKENAQSRISQNLYALRKRASSVAENVVIANLMTKGWGRSAIRTAVLSCILACCLCRAQEIEGNRQVVIRVNPQYPSLARGMKLQGSVKVEAIVAPDGSVKTVAIKGGHPLLAQAAHDAVQKWKWVPASKEPMS